MKKETKAVCVLIVYAALFGIFTICTILKYQIDTDYIKELEQNNIEQMEEKEVYMNKCKMMEDLLKANGLVDECECG